MENWVVKRKYFCNKGNSLMAGCDTWVHLLRWVCVVENCTTYWRKSVRLKMCTGFLKCNIILKDKRILRISKSYCVFKYIVSYWLASWLNIFMLLGQLIKIFNVHHLSLQQILLNVSCLQGTEFIMEGKQGMGQSPYTRFELTPFEHWMP